MPLQAPDLSPQLLGLVLEALVQQPFLLLGGDRESAGLRHLGAQLSELGENPGVWVLPSPWYLQLVVQCPLVLSQQLLALSLQPGLQLLHVPSLAALGLLPPLLGRLLCHPLCRHLMLRRLCPCLLPWGAPCAVSERVGGVTWGAGVGSHLQAPCRAH